MSRAEAMERILHRVAQSAAAEHWVLRGGLLSQWWCAPYPRPADDVDFLALYDFDRERTDALVAALGISQAAPCEVIWAETETPGLRYQLQPAPDEVVQVDIAFGDPLPAPPHRWAYPTALGPAHLLVIGPAVGLAWKLHGLFEFEDGHWRPKDLHDILLFLQHADIDWEALPAAIRLAFSSRDTPLSAIDRLLCGEMGHSRGSRGNWAKLARARPDVVPMRDAFSQVAEALRPVVEALHPPLRHPLAGPFPTITHIDDVLPAIDGDPVFRRHTQPGLVVLNAERSSPTHFPPPEGGTSARIRAHRLLRRECRGLAFDSDGNLLARRYHKFFQLSEQKTDTSGGPPLVLEKLDGAMLSPARLPDGIRLLSRRGRSLLADAAQAFAEADAGAHHALWADWVDRGWTPILEWCAREHRIVIDHPQPRLVLTGIRNRTDGRYLPYGDLAAVAREHGVEVVASHGRLDDLRRLVRATEADRGREGVVLRFDDGRMIKLKTLQYRRLHRAREATQRERATWEVLISGEVDLLRPLLPAEEAERLDALHARYQAALASRIAALAQEAAALQAASISPAALAEQVRDRPGFERSALFAGLSGRDVAEAVHTRAANSTQHARGLKKLREWLGL